MSKGIQLWEIILKELFREKDFTPTFDFVLSLFGGVASPENTGIWNPLDPNATVSPVLLTHQVLRSPVPLSTAAFVHVYV